jgi:hypothetical protein
MHEQNEDRIVEIIKRSNAPILHRGDLVWVVASGPEWFHVAFLLDRRLVSGFMLTPLVDVDPPPECATSEHSKLNWKCPSSSRNTVPLATFRATSSEVPTVFYVSAQLSDYFNYEYAGAQKSHYSVEIREGGSMGNTLHAYLPRKHPTASALFDVLKDGAPHTVTVELAYSKHSRSTDIARMTRFLCGGWSCKSTE